MKNAAKYASVLKALAKKLSKASAPEDLLGGQAEESRPLRAIVLGVLRRDADEAAAVAAIEAIEAEYVDFNDLRAGTDLELVDLLTPHFGEEEAAARSTLIRGVLSNIFDVEGRLTLDRIAALGRRELRPALRKAVVGGTGDPSIPLAFVEAHAALLAFDFGTLPIDERTLALLLKHKAVDDDVDALEAAKFCEQNLKVEDCRAIFAAARDGK